MTRATGRPILEECPVSGAPQLRTRATVGAKRPHLTPRLGWTSEPAAPVPPRDSRPRQSGRPSGHSGRPDVSPTDREGVEGS